MNFAFGETDRSLSCACHRADLHAQWGVSRL